MTTDTADVEDAARILKEKAFAGDPMHQLAAGRRPDCKRSRQAWHGRARSV